MLYGMSILGFYIYCQGLNQGVGFLLSTLPFVIWSVRHLHLYINTYGSVLQCVFLDGNFFELVSTGLISTYTLPLDFDVPLHLWECFRGSFIYFILGEGSKLILQYILIRTIFFIHGFSQLFEGLDFKTMNDDLSPLIGGPSHLFQWRTMLIDQCWKRKRKRKRKYSGTDVVQFWLRVRKWDSAAIVMTKSWESSFPIQMASDLVAALDVLDMNRLMEADNVGQVLAGRDIHMKTLHLRSIINSADG